MSSHTECCHRIATPSVHQTLDELEFERGIWNSAFYDDVEKLKTQLDKGTDPSVCDKAGYTALHYAARNGKESACYLLLIRGANVNAQTPGGATPLLRACSQGHTRIVQMLLKNNADPSIPDSDGKTPLHKAAEGQHFDTAVLLVKYKPELKNIEDKQGHLPFYYVNPKCTELINLLQNLKEEC